MRCSSTYSVLLKFFLFNISINFFVFSGCSSGYQKAPIIDAPAIPNHRIQKHLVAPGETLYSIALRYDMDHKKLSQINGLNQSSRIVPGQELSLDLSNYRPPPPPSKTASTAASAWRRVRSAVDPVVKERTNPVVRTAPSVVSTGSVSWQWPLNGKVLKGFSPEMGLNKGIDIDGKLGEPVNAASDGDVVYSGSGLRGYGKLLIVKHNEKYLSAYAHNRVLHVTEGDKVKAGQRIGEVGFSGTNSPKLHFEIRLDGKPVDPLKYLPKQ